MLDAIKQEPPFYVLRHAIKCQNRKLGMEIPWWQNWYQKNLAEQGLFSLIA
jgi:hypothetical protein